MAGYRDGASAAVRASRSPTQRRQFWFGLMLRHVAPPVKIPNLSYSFARDWTKSFVDYWGLWIYSDLHGTSMQHGARAYRE